MALATLNQLYVVLASKPKQERITPEESNTIFSCHVKALWTAGFASGIGGGLVSLVANRFKMRKGKWLNLVAGTGFVIFGVAWDLASSRTAVSCLDHILKQDATRIQKELVNVLVKSNKGEGWRLKLMSKHFYPEAVYSDKGDKPQMRWRRRTTFTELASSYDDLSEVKSQTTPNDLPNSPNQSTSHASDISRTKKILQKYSGDSDQEMLEDPLECIFGDSETTESNLLPGKSKSSSKVLTRKQKRAQRRQRLKNREAFADTPQYELA